MTDTGLPPDLPGAAQPNYGAQRPPVQPAQPLAQNYPPPQYPHPYPVKPKGLSTGAKVGIFGGLGCLVLILVAAVIIALVAAASIATSGARDDDPFDFPSTSDDGSSSNGNTIGTTESRWKSGADWLAPPIGDAAPGSFIAGYPTAESYLQYAMGIYSFTVVFTADPAYNCGVTSTAPTSDDVVGCYDPDYGDTLFLWWGESSSDDLRALVLLREYSHYYQYYEYFDATRSALDAGLFDDPSFVSEVWETDATCRVYVDWHYTNLRYLDDSLPYPCGDAGWGTHWFENELRERGVTVTDY